jgi:hypothetical protein
MMKNRIAYPLLLLLIFTPTYTPNLGLFGGGSVFTLLSDKLVSQSPTAPKKGILDTRDPVLVAQIEELALCESSGRENIKILDTNGWYSHGCLQFQVPTFKQYCERYGIFPEAEYEDYINLIGDCQIQKDLAYDMIKEDPKNWGHWKVCGEKLGFI